MRQKILILSCLLSLVFGFLGGIVAKYFPEISSSIPIFLQPNIGENVPRTPEKIVTTSQEQAVIEAVKRISPSVVSVVLSKDVPVFKEYPWFPFELFPEFQVPQYKEEGTEKKQIGAGSGFIVSQDGLILTNRHVVERDDVDYTVILQSEKEYPAKVLARDPIQDLAIIKIEAKDLTPVTLGESDQLNVGQTVIAIGYALGEFKNTVSVGVVSGLQRNIVAQDISGRVEEIEEVIQTDAAINQGNSGGPLLNLSGEVIGINVAVAMGAENIGFAIPINKTKKVIKDVQEKGKITYPFLGVVYRLIDKDLQKEYNLPVDYGALIVRDEKGIAVIPGSGADKAGLQENDIILELNGEKITKKNSLGKMILKYQPGEMVELKILRKGREMKLKVVLGEY